MRTARLALLACLIALAPAGARDFDLARSHVIESDEAAYQIERAERSGQEGQWEECVSGYLKVLERWPDSVFAIDAADGKGTLYVGTAAWIRQRLLALDPAGRAAFRKLYDAKVEGQYALASAAMDRAALKEIADTWFLASRGDDALWLLAKVHEEEGRPDLALPLLERLSRLDSQIPRAVVYARWAECLAALGQPEAIRALLKDPALPAGDRVRLGDGEAVLGVYLSTLASRPAPGARAAGVPERWETLGGDGTRNLAMGPDVPLPPKAWSWKIPPGATRRLQNRWMGNMGEDDTLTGKSQVVPAVADGVVYLHNDIELRAFDLVANEPKMLWRVPTTVAPSSVLPEPRVLHTVTVHDGVVYANLVSTCGREEEQLDFLVVKAPLPCRSLCAISARTGKLLWRAGGIETAKDVKLKASFQAAPAVEKGRVYAGAVFQKSQTDPVEHHVFCLDAATGEVIWSQYVAEGYLEMNLFNNPTREIVGSSVTLDAEAVYYCTNFGIVASLDKETGRTRWLRRYEQYHIPPTRDVYVQPMPTGWENNPIVVAGGTLFVAPMDSPYLFGFDALEGKDKPGWKLCREAGERGPATRATWVLGAQGGRLVLAGPDRAVAIETRTAKKLWEWHVAQSDPIVGRGGITESTVYLPCQSGLVRLDLGTGEKTGMDRWPDPQRDAGNVVVFDNTVVTASVGQLSVFYSWEVLSAYLDRELARSPADPALRLRAARSLLAAGKAEQALPHLAKAIELGGASGDAVGARIADEARDLLGQIHRTIAMALLEGGKADAAAKELREALRYAGDPAARVRTRRDLGRALATAGKASEAIAELARIFPEDPDAPADGGRAWDAARLDIAAIVRRAGPEAYAEQEAQARERLAAAGEAPAKIEEVIRLYPNARAAEEASYRLGEVHMKAGRLEQAAGQLRTFVRDYPDSERLAQATVDLAECYRKRGMETKARVVLRQVARRIGASKVVVDGKETTIEAYFRDVLGASGGLAPVLLPTVGWPVDQAWQLIERRTDTLRLLSVSGEPPAGAAAPVLVAAGRRLRAVSPTKGEVAWEREFSCEPQRCGWTEGGIVVVLERDQCAALDPSNGQVRWTCELPGLVLGSAVTDTGALAVVADKKNLMLQRVVSIDSKTGKEDWRIDLDQQQARPDLWLTPDALVLATASRQGPSLLVIDRDSGEIERTIPVEGGIGRAALLPPDQIALVTGDRNEDLRVYEISSGALLWMASEKRIEVETFSTNGVQIGFVGVNASGAYEVVVLDAETGKVAARAPTGSQDYVKGGAIDEQNLYVTYRDAGANRSVYLKAYSLADASTRWSQPIASGDQYLVMPLHVARGAVIVPTPMQKLDNDRDNPFVPVFTVVGTADGQVEQQVRMSVRGRFPPDLKVVDGMVMVVQGNRIYGMRHR